MYAILDVDAAAARGLTPADLLARWVDAGVRVVQLRAKRLESGALFALSDTLVPIARRSGARLIINDRADIASVTGADGVHVGQDDLPAAAVRRMLGPAAWLGLSTHTDAQVASGAAEPVTYLAIGPVFTTTKPGAAPVVGLAGVRRAAARAHVSSLPLVAIGGITIEQAPAVIEAGADAVAVITDLLTDDSGARVRQYLRDLE